MNAEVIGQAVLFQVHVDGKVEQQLQQKCCLPNEVALNEKGKLRKLFCKHLADCKHNCHGETTPQDRSHSKNKDSLAPVSSPSLLNRYNSRRVYVTCVGVVHFPYPILIIISEQRDIIPYNTHNPKTRIHELWHTPKIHFEGKCQAAKPFTTPESISPAQKQHRKNSNKDIHKDPDTIYQIFQQDDYPHF